MKTTAEKFARILEADRMARTQSALAAMGVDYTTRARGERNLVIAKWELNDAIDALTADEMGQFGAYLRAQRTEVA